MDTLKDKKIAYLITQSHFGGAQKYILDLARYFGKSNEIVILVGEEQNQDQFFFASALELGIRPIIIKNLVRNVSIVKGYEAIMEIRRVLMRERPDILHVNSSMAGALGSFAAWLYRFDPLNRAVRVIYTVHGFVFNEPLPYFKKRIYLLAEKITTSFKGAFITVSQFDKNEGLKNKVAPDKRMVVIHNGVDIEQKFLDRKVAREQLGMSDRKSLIIGTIASLYKTKGLEYLIRAAALLTRSVTDLQFVIIGDGPEKEALIDLIRDENLTDKIHLIGRRDHAASYLKAFDIFVLPSVKEGLPLTVLEAGLAHVPVIASRVGGIPEIITHDRDGLLVPAANPEALAVTLKKLIADPSLRKRLSAQNKANVEKNFTLEKMNKKTEDVYLQFYPQRKQQVVPVKKSAGEKDQQLPTQ